MPSTVLNTEETVVNKTGEGPCLLQLLNFLILKKHYIVME